MDVHYMQTDSSAVHGEMRLSWEGDLLVSRPKGPFNVEGMHQAAKDIKATVEAAGHHAWCYLALLDNEALWPIEGKSSAENILQWVFENGCQAMAIVYANAIQEEVFRFPEFARVQLFDNQESAKQWLSGLLAA